MKNMRKLLPLVILSAAACTAAAQDYLSTWRADGSVVVNQLAEVDSLTFTLPENDVTLTTGSATAASATSMTVNLSASAAVQITGTATERGVCYSQASTEPTTDNIKVADGPFANGGWSATLTNLVSSTTYYYRAYAVLGGQTYYGPVKTFTAGADETSQESQTVDLGLSVDWASCNVTAAAATSSLSDVSLSASVAYTVTTQRGAWYAGSSLTSTTKAGVTADATDGNQQFAFVTSATDASKVYLYSVGQGKFVKKDGSLSAANPDRIYIFHDTGNTTYPYFFSFTADKSGSNINIGGSSQITIDSWKTYDAGNMCQLTEATDAAYDLAAAQALLPADDADAAQSAPTSYGGYYAWGETATKSDYTWSTYTLGNGEARTKYTTSDGQTTLAATDDAASVNLGGNWRLPTQAEFQELKDKCEWVWVSESGVNGYRVIAPNGNSIFLPAAGFSYTTKTYDAGDFGYYLTSTRATDDSRAYVVGINATSAPTLYPAGRAFGYSVRAVRAK